MALLEEMQGVARRMMICGLHVHVGIDDDELRIDLMNQARYFLPHLLALSCSSPFWEGERTGLMSFRLMIFNGIPRTGLPEKFASWNEYRRHTDTLIETGILADTSRIWWDLRPSARYPTLETRVMDSCTTLEDSVRLAALNQCLMRKLYRLRRDNQQWRPYPDLLIGENRWRAMRYSYDAGLLDLGRQRMVPFGELVEEIIELLREDAIELGCLAEIEGLRDILERGTSAHRQLRIFETAVQSGATEAEAFNTRGRLAGGGNRAMTSRPLPRTLAAGFCGGCWWWPASSHRRDVPTPKCRHRRPREPARASSPLVRNVMVAMRDGVRLATDVYLPARDGAPLPGPFPVILERTPYNKDGRAAGLVELLRAARLRRSSCRTCAAATVRRPLASAHATTRRTGTTPRSGSARSRGRTAGIGTVGTSYAGGTQHALAIGNGAHLVKAMIPRRRDVATSAATACATTARSSCAGSTGFHARERTAGHAECAARLRSARRRIRPRHRLCVEIGERVREYVRRCRCGPARRRSSSRPTTRPG